MSMKPGAILLLIAVVLFLLAAFDVSLGSLNLVTLGFAAFAGSARYSARRRAALEDIGRTTEEHLWIRGNFFETSWRSGAFSGFEQAGVRRVVFGHTPLPNGALTFHEGRSLGIDTNACGNPQLPPGARRMVTLVELTGEVALAAARRVIVATDDAPDGRPR